MDISDFAELMSGLESLAVSVAAIGAGIWAIFTFRFLGARDRAKLELEQLRSNLKSQAVVSIALNVTKLSIDPKYATHLLIEVTFQNFGSRNVHLLNSDNPTVFLDKFDSATGEHFAAYEKLFEIDYVLRIGVTHSESYVVPITEPGLYRVWFEVPVTETEKKIAAEVGQNTDGSVWSAHKYVSVEDA